MTVAHRRPMVARNVPRYSDRPHARRRHSESWSRLS